MTRITEVEFFHVAWSDGDTNRALDMAGLQDTLSTRSAGTEEPSAQYGCLSSSVFQVLPTGIHHRPIPPVALPGFSSSLRPASFLFGSTRSRF